jgi:hypothetical protein
MGLLPFLCLSVAFLGFPVGLSLCSISARLSAVGLSPPAALTHQKHLTTPTAGYFLQKYHSSFFDMPSSGLSICPKL